MRKTKRQLRRELKRCRRELASAERAVASGGVCLPVGEWGELRESPGIRYATPEPEQTPCPLCEGLTARERMAEQSAAEWRERATTEQTARMAMEAKLREAERHLEYHHRNGSFTLIREVTPQVARENERLHAEVERQRHRADTAEHALYEATNTGEPEDDAADWPDDRMGET